MDPKRRNPTRAFYQVLVEIQSLIKRAKRADRIRARKRGKIAKATHPAALTFILSKSNQWVNQ